MNTDLQIFRKVFIKNNLSYHYEETVSGYIYLSEGQEKPDAHDYIENYLHILKKDKSYYLLLDRTDYESDNIKELEGYLFELSKGDYHNCKYEIIDESDLIQVYFGFI